MTKKLKTFILTTRAAAKWQFEVKHK